MDKEILKKRTKDFAVRILALSESIPNSVSGRAIANQIVRSGTSVAANYRAALRARSKAEFLAKLGIVIEEADETLFWLELIVESKIMHENRILSLIQETDESCNFLCDKKVFKC